MARIYICPIIGSGTETDPQRAALVDVTGVTRCKAAISVGPTGIKRYGWTICMVEARNWSAVEDMPRAIRLDAPSLDATIPETKRRALLAELKDDVQLDVGMKTRAVLRKLIKAHYPDAGERDVLS